MNENIMQMVAMWPTHWGWMLPLISVTTATLVGLGSLGLGWMYSFVMQEPPTWSLNDSIASGAMGPGMPTPCRGFSPPGLLRDA